MNTAGAHCLIILSGKAYKIRPLTDCDGWLADLCGRAVLSQENVVLSRMFGMYRYMGWIHGLKKNHSQVLRGLYRERKEHVRQRRG